jgi:hypothetical protein
MSENAKFAIPPPLVSRRIGHSASVGRENRAEGTEASTKGAEMSQEDLDDSLRRADFSELARAFATLEVP